MGDLDWQGLLPAWAVVLCALLVPVLLALGFFTAMDYANPPTTGELKPGQGQMMASTNMAIVMVHGLAQLAFLVFGAWWLPRTTAARVLFLVIAIPFCGLVFLMSFFGVMAP